MRTGILTTVLLITLSMMFMSCASSYYSRGQKYLEDQDYNQAIKELRMAIVEDYRNIEAVRDLGIALYYQGRTKLAEKFLRLAMMRRPNDPLIFYHLGLAYEENGDIDKAIEMYSHYADVSPLNSLRKEIEERLVVLLRQQMAQEIKTAIAQEKMLDVRKIPDHSIAVLYFVDAKDRNNLTPLQKGLADMLITDLSQVKELTVVERARLQMLMQEMGLGMSGLIDQRTAPKMGALLGAAQLVEGTLLDLGDNTLRIDAGLMDIKSKKMKPADKITGNLKEFYRIEKSLVFSIIDELGVKLSSQERKAIEKIPTKNMMAFMAYCRGLDFEDRGLWHQAQREFDAAVRYDPKFNLAQQGLNRARAFSQFSPKPPKHSFAEIKKIKMRRVRAGRGVAPGPGKRKAGKGFIGPNQTLASHRLYRTATEINPGFVPSIESRLPATEESTPTFGTSAPILIQVPLPVKN